MGWRKMLPANSWRVPTPLLSRYSTRSRFVNGASGFTEIRKPNHEHLPSKSGIGRGMYFSSPESASNRNFAFEILFSTNSSSFFSC